MLEGSICKRLVTSIIYLLNEPPKKLMIYEYDITINFSQVRYMFLLCIKFCRITIKRKTKIT